MFRKLSSLALLLSVSQLMLACQGAGHLRPEWVQPVRHEPDSRAFDAEHYRLSLTVDPPQRRIVATCALRLRAKEEVSELELDFVGMSVSGVRNLRGEELPFEQDEEGLKIDLLGSRSPGEVV